MGVDRKVEKISRFIHRVRAMGDDDAVYVIPVCHILNVARQLQQQFFGHTGAVDIAELFPPYGRIVRHLRYRLDKIVNRNFSGLIADEFRLGCGPAGNGSAASDNIYSR